jgi:hypothetical protein
MTALPPELARSIARFAKRLRARHSIDRRTAEQLARLLRSALVPRRKPGRKPTLRVLTALRMRSKGVPWPEVYTAVLYGYSGLHPCERLYHARKLRRAVAALKKRRRSRVHL